MNWIEDVKGVLLDVDGTLLNEDRPIAGAARALSRLRERDIRIRFTTNTTRRPRSRIAAVLRGAGFQVETDEVIVPSILARRRILDSGRLRAGFLLPSEALEDLDGVEVDEEDPHWVVVGDMGREFTWDRMNKAFRWLLNGAEMLALQKNPYWKAGPEGLVLDAGPYVTALEYGSGKQAEVVGKPSGDFFKLALAHIDLLPEEVMVVGDNLECDCEGGRAAGCRTALVLTGNTDRKGLDSSNPPADLVLDSIAELLV